MHPFPRAASAFVALGCFRFRWAAIACEPWRSALSFERSLHVYPDRVRTLDALQSIRAMKRLRLMSGVDVSILCAL